MFFYNSAPELVGMRLGWGRCWGVDGLGGDGLGGDGLGGDGLGWSGVGSGVGAGYIITSRQQFA